MISSDMKCKFLTVLAISQLYCLEFTDIIAGPQDPVAGVVYSAGIGIMAYAILFMTRSIKDSFYIKGKKITDECHDQCTDDSKHKDQAFDSAKYKNLVKNSAELKAITKDIQFIDKILLAMFIVWGLYLCTRIYYVANDLDCAYFPNNIIANFTRSPAAARAIGAGLMSLALMDPVFAIAYTAPRLMCEKPNNLFAD